LLYELKGRIGTLENEVEELDKQLNPPPEPDPERSECATVGCETIVQHYTHTHCQSCWREMLNKNRKKKLGATHFKSNQLKRLSLYD